MSEMRHIKNCFGGKGAEDLHCSNELQNEMSLNVSMKLIWGADLMINSNY